ncbi:MAG: MaoC/PaaZ C-terminal domain-containing protein [Actinomycetota bacterium]
MGLNADLVGKRYDERTYEVTAEAIARYAEATNDGNERYLGNDPVASPVFPVVPAFESFMNATMDSELQADVMRLVHGSEEHVLHSPIRAGDVLTIRGEIEAIERKETGETFTVRATETNQDGDVAAEVRGTMFIRGTGSGRGAAGAGEEPEREVVFEETTKVDDDQTFRYAEASGDHNPIHLDESFAQTAGLPGIILHGMCTMAIATKAAVNGPAGGDPTRVKRVSVRFSRPVRPGQELTTRLWEEAASAGLTTYGFETLNPRGQAVIRSGIVEVAGA